MVKIKITECPRDAMQGLKTFIPTQVKADYLNTLLQVGFDILDFGSFVSPKAIPQMKDTRELIPLLKIENSPTRLLAIVANVRGGNEAVQFEEISLLGYPFSISPTFLKKNINASVSEAFNTAWALNDICQKHNKELVVYISMAFGNPYNDPWSEELLLQWIDKLYQAGIKLISLADTVGFAIADTIGRCYGLCKTEYQDIEFGIHLHSRLQGIKEKLSMAYENGCRRYDSVLDGLGGCPMAGNDLVGNLDTFTLMQFLKEIGRPLPLDNNVLQTAKLMASHYFKT